MSPSHPFKASTRCSNGITSLPFCPSSRSLFQSGMEHYISHEQKLTHLSLTRELEKKFSDRHVLILASRRILPRPKRSNRSRTSQTQKRPRSRTLTAVHDAILTDLVFPVEIVGKRLRTKEDGSKVLKVVLDEKEKNTIDHRLDTYSEVYRRLTGRGVNFEFPVAPVEY